MRSLVLHNRVRSRKTTLWESAFLRRWRIFTRGDPVDVLSPRAQNIRFFFFRFRAYNDDCIGYCMMCVFISRPWTHFLSEKLFRSSKSVIMIAGSKCYLVVNVTLYYSRSYHNNLEKLEYLLNKNYHILHNFF